MSALGSRSKLRRIWGFSSDAKEAVAFALLGDRCLAGLPNSLPAVTGCGKCRNYGQDFPAASVSGTAEPISKAGISVKNSGSTPRPRRKRSISGQSG